MMDTTTARAHAQAAGGKGGSIRMFLGRSRGGFSTKIHARSDHQGRPLGFVLTGGEVSDYRGVDELLALPVAKPKIMSADKGFDGDGVRSALLLKGISPVIPPRANRVNPPVCDFKAYKDRNRIERMFSKLKQFRRIATRYDKTKLSYAGFLALAAAQIWLPAFVNTA